MTCVVFSRIDEQVVQDGGEYLANDFLFVAVERLVLAGSDDGRLRHAEVAQLSRTETLSTSSQTS